MIQSFDVLALLRYYKEGVTEAGCDEAGRGCLAGPVFAAAVVLPPDFELPLLNDSKKLTPKNRYALREEIRNVALCYAIASVENEEIDKMNIFKASMLAMHRALEQLNPVPEHLLIDGKYFYPYKNIPYQCIVEGDGKYLSIAAASVLAKTYRDDYMIRLSSDYPEYGWDSNKGYATARHRQALKEYGATPYHRKSFKLLPDAHQLELKNLRDQT
ncbi:MAG: ribonuclease HII [Bacteroidota bacterium]